MIPRRRTQPCILWAESLNNPAFYVRVTRAGYIDICFPNGDGMMTVHQIKRRKARTLVRRLNSALADTK